MTVTYSQRVSNAKYFGLVRLLVLWKGSIYKLVYKEMIIFCLFYCSLFATYRYLLNPFQQQRFENLSQYFSFYLKYMSPFFFLGLYITLIVYRWWKLLDAIPSSKTLSDLISAFVRGSDERSRIIRRTLVRWANLMIVLTFQCISVAVKKRFPTIDHLVEAGLMTEEEKYAYEEISVDVDKWLVPGEWFAETVFSLSSEGRITHYEVDCLVKEMELLRDNCEELFDYDYVSVPLAFTQLVTISVYAYFVCIAMGRQCLNLENNSFDFRCDWSILVFVILEYLFYMGVFKVAEQLINPFGENDDDFDVNSVIDSGFQESLLNVDGMHDMLVDVEDHAIWDDPQSLPYTKATASLKSIPHLGSASNLNIDPKNSEFLLMHDAHHIDCEDYTSELSEATTVSNKRLSSLNLSPIPQLNVEDVSFESSVGSEIGLDSPCFDQNTENMLNESNVSSLIKDNLDFSRQSSSINLSKNMKKVV